MTEMTRCLSNNSYGTASGEVSVVFIRHLIGERQSLLGKMTNCPNSIAFVRQLPTGYATNSLYVPGNKDNNYRTYLYEPGQNSNYTIYLYEPGQDSNETTYLYEPGQDSNETTYLYEPGQDSNDTTYLYEPGQDSN